VLDTSVLVGVEAGRLLTAALPAEGVLPVVVLEELWLGVLASNGPARDQRHATFEAARASYDVAPVTPEVALVCAAIRAEGRVRGVRYHPFDALVGATGRVLGIPVVTQDRGFEGMAGVDVRIV